MHFWPLPPPGLQRAVGRPPGIHEESHEESRLLTSAANQRTNRSQPRWNIGYSESVAPPGVTRLVTERRRSIGFGGQQSFHCRESLFQFSILFLLLRDL